MDRRDEGFTTSHKWGAQNLFQFLNCFCTKLSQFLAGAAGVEAAQRGAVSSGGGVLSPCMMC